METLVVKRIELTPRGKQKGKNFNEGHTIQ